MKNKKNTDVDLEKQRLVVFEKAIDKGLPILERYLNSKLSLEKPKFRWGLVAFITILSLMVLVTAFLVYNNKMDSGNFTFLLGTLIGATITMLGDIIIPREN